MVVRILTERVNERDTLALVCQHFTDFTYYHAQGVCQGLGENTLVIEVDAVTPVPQFADRVRALAIAIKNLNKQQAVLIQEIPTYSYMV